MNPDDPNYEEWLCDQFAMHALNGILSCPDSMPNLDALVKDAWRIANMMLIERNKVPE